MASRIATFRRKIALGQYELTGHAKDEMEQDGFTIHDVKTAVYGGKILMSQRHDPGPRKYVVRGRILDGRQIDVVCRLTELRRLRVITVFAVRS